MTNANPAMHCSSIAALVLAALGLAASPSQAQQTPAPAPPGGLSDCASVDSLNARQLALRTNGNGPLASDPAPSDPALRTELLALRDRDLEARGAASASAQANGGRPDQQLVLAIFAADSENINRLKEIVEAGGFPGVAKVGRDGVAAAFILTQHADRDREFQARVLTQMQPPAAKGEVSPQDLAQLTDRVRIGEGRPQLYGSQFRAVGSVNHPQPIENAAQVDQRRGQAGLLSLRDYGCIMQQVYGFPVDLAPHAAIVTR